MVTLSLSDYGGGNCSVRAPADALKVKWQELGMVASFDCWFAQPKGLQRPQSVKSLSSKGLTASSCVTQLWLKMT